jgi:hypothetical protein
MITILRKRTEKPEGQVLLATLFFCFIFAVLFAGLYKSGLVYSLKERSNRSGELTALSAGAVYANGMQLVRLTNLILVAYAMIDLTVIAAAVTAASAVSLGTLAAAATKADPHLRKIVQDLQKVLFGIDIPVPGIYPLLILTEGFSTADKNTLTTQWALPPSPLFLFSLETSTPFFISVVPTMALKFRTAGQFIRDMDDPKTKKVYYQYQDQKTGTYHYVEKKDTELAPNSTNEGQRRIKNGLAGSGKLLKLEPVIMEGAERDALGSAGGVMKEHGILKIQNSFGAIASLLNGVEMDVTDRDDPPNHTLVVYSTLPTRLQRTNQSTANLQSVNETSVEGPGLAAWDFQSPLYQARLLDPDVSGMAQVIASQTNLQNLIDSAKTSFLSNGPNLPAALAGF